MITPDAHLSLIAFLFALAWFGFAVERTRAGRALTGTVWVILVAILASNLSLIPQSAPAYDFVFTYLVPVIIPLFLFRADLVRIVRETGRVGVAFAFACLGTTLGAIAGTMLFDLGPRAGDLAGIFTATYTGGSVNFAALIQSTGFDDASMIAAATAVDHLASALLLAGLAAMPAWSWLVERFAPYSDDGPQAGSQADLASSPVTGQSLAASIALALGLVAVAFGICEALDLEGLRYVVLTVLVLVPATAFPTRMARLGGAEELGVILAYVFFAALAAGADVRALLLHAPVLLGYVAVLLVVHALVLFGSAALWARTLRLWAPEREAAWGLSLPELITASNAAILGATTAPALAAARGWTGLVSPGVLVGVAGYAIGTPLGIAVARLLAP